MDRIINLDKEKIPNLKMNLVEIRKSIEPYKIGWRNISTTNCYAYALGLDISRYEIAEKNFAYNPGIFSKSGFCLVSTLFRYSELMESLYADFESLGLCFETCNPNDIAAYNEWKIAIFTHKLYGYILNDFHFLRQGTDGIWRHKPGYTCKPTKYDSKGIIISDIRNCNYDNYVYQKCYKLKKNIKY